MPVIAGHYVVAYANSAGFVNDDLYTATAIAMAETGWNTDYHFTGPETDQRGLWAINAWGNNQFNRAQLFDPTYNAWAARQLFLKAGNGWTPWQSYIDQTYVDYFPDVDKAMADYQGYGGDPGSTTAPPVSGTPPPILSGLYPNFGAFDPAPYLRRVGDTFHDWANQINATTNAINNLIR